MAELADAPDLGSGGRPCRFKSCHPQAENKVFVRIVIEELSFITFFVSGKTGLFCRKALCYRKSIDEGKEENRLGTEDTSTKEIVSENIAKALIRKALQARRKAYSPYSHFQVGVALETDSGEIFLGCNVENASYGASNCGERTAVFKAVSEGYKHFQRIAIVGGMKDSEELPYCMPCGICRQVMAEFVDLQSFQVILAKNEEEYKIYTLAELLPHAFLPEALED